MFFFPETGRDAQRVRRGMRIAIMAGAFGSIIGGGIVIASVATVLSVITPANDKQAAAPKTLAPAGPPPAQTAPAQTQTVSRDCAEQTWPNIEQRCLTRVENTQTTGGPVATPATPTVALAAPPAVEPAELQPGSPALPAPPAVLTPQTTASTPSAVLSPAPSLTPTSAPSPAMSAQPQPAPGAETPTAKPAPKTTAPKQPIRKAERPKRPAQSVARSADDDDDDLVGQRAPAATSTQRRVVTVTRDADDDVDARPAQRRIVIYPPDSDAIDRPPRSIPRARTGAFSDLFGSRDD